LITRPHLPYFYRMTIDSVFARRPRTDTPATIPLVTAGGGEPDVAAARSVVLV